MRAAIVFLALTTLAPRLAHAATLTEVHYVMGTYFRVTVAHADASLARRVMRECFATARRCDERFSRFDPASELSSLNSHAAESTFAVSDEMAALLQRSVALSAATDGAFDVGVGALSGLWRTATEWPPAAAIAAARATGGVQALHLANTTLVRRPGTRIDLDGIAKGWAVDRCAAQLRTAGIDRALLSLGESSLYALGAPPGANGWDVEVRALDGGRALGTLQLRDQALSVSAVFGHERQVGGRRVGHIVDPRSGMPLTSPAIAVVIAASATDAEAFSKAVLIRGDAQLAILREQGSESTIEGALLIRPHGVHRAGTVAFTAHPVAWPIAAAAEPLR